MVAFVSEERTKYVFEDFNHYVGNFRERAVRPTFGSYVRLTYVMYSYRGRALLRLVAMLEAIDKDIIKHVSEVLSTQKIL